MATSQPMTETAVSLTETAGTPVAHSRSATRLSRGGAATGHFVAGAAPRVGSHLLPILRRPLKAPQ
jgi:hypothetical protein